MRIIKVLSLICFFTICAFAQQGANISGILTAKNGKPLASITIKLEKDSVVYREGSTDDNGEYFLEDVPDGVYSFVYKDENGNDIREIIEVKNGRDVNRVSGNRISETVTISADTNQTIEEVSKSVNIVEAQELRERADFALVETLKTIPGFRVQQLGGFGRTATIKTRGLRNQDTAILIDGIRFRDASSITGDASAFLSDFTLTSVSRIEVLRGSGSSLYGTNAIGGTIDFQTPKPQSRFHGQLSGALGGLGLKRIRGNVSNGNDKFGFNLGVSRTVYSEGIDGDDEAHNTNFQSRVEYNPLSKTNISARFFVSDAFVKLNSNPDTIGTLPATNATVIRAVPLSRGELQRYENGASFLSLNQENTNFVPDANDPDAFQKSQFFNGQLVLTQILKGNLVFQGFYSGLKTSRKNTNGVLGIGFQPFGGAENSVFDGNIHTLNGHFNWTPNSANEITFGYEFERETFRNNGFANDAASNFTTRAGQSSNTLYAQDLLKFFDNRLQIAGGFRAQFFNLENPTFSGTNPPYQNISLENPPSAYTFDGSASYYFAKTGTKIRAHVGNGYRVPSLYERFGTFYSSFSQDFTALGEPNLEPERSIAFDGGVDQTFFSNQAKLSAVYFYTRLIDTIGFGNVVPNIGATIRPFGGYINTKGGIARGAEFSADVKPFEATSFFASYTFTNSDQRTPQVSGSGISQTLGVPNHQFTLVATQRFGKNLSVNFDFLATSDYLAPIFDTNNFTFNSYVYQFKGARKGDLTARYEIPANEDKLRFVLFGTIENIFDYDYYENGFRTFGRTGRVGFGVSF